MTSTPPDLTPEMQEEDASDAAAFKAEEAAPTDRDFVRSMLYSELGRLTLQISTWNKKSVKERTDSDFLSLVRLHARRDAFTSMLDSINAAWGDVGS